MKKHKQDNLTIHNADCMGIDKDLMTADFMRPTNEDEDYFLDNAHFQGLLGKDEEAAFLLGRQYERKSKQIISHIDNKKIHLYNDEELNDLELKLSLKIDQLDCKIERFKLNTDNLIDEERALLDEQIKSKDARRYSYRSWKYITKAIQDRNKKRKSDEKKANEEKSKNQNDSAFYLVKNKLKSLMDEDKYIKFMNSLT
tara:strand:+ start:245 stop:841 length:597 start_codon:yes stop_codon:yes gene_type:complete